MPAETPRRAGRAVPVLRAEFGMFKIGASRFDLRDPYHFAVSLPLPHFALLTLAIWLAINVLFAALYVLDPGGVANAAPWSFPQVFFFSIETLATVGYGVMAPVSTYAHIVSATEIVVGMAFTAIVTGVLFVRFSRPRARIAYADNPVITTFNDHRTLMIRLANSRLTVMTNANAKLFALISERTQENRLFRRLHTLPLVQPHLPLFVMPWTLMHVIDETSPLFGYGEGNFAAADIRLFVTVEARDQAIEATVYDMKLYVASDVRFGMRYADSVMIDNEGRATADLSRISLLEAESAEQPEWAQWVR